MLRSIAFVFLLMLLANADLRAAAATQPGGPVVRVAVIGGMNETGFWDGIAQRFEKESGIHVDAVATGNKDGIASVFKHGGIDLITMHSSDTMINLVADGYAMDPQPWARNDMIIVGPAADPAGIKGSTDAAAALKKIIATKAKFMVHSSLGAQEVLRDILDQADLQLNDDTTKILLEDRQRMALKTAQEDGSYTLIGRIPFLRGKIPSEGMAAMCAGDARLQRPFLVAVANPARVADARLDYARKLAGFLRSPATQAWIAEFGKGKYDDRSLFFPVVISSH